MAAESPPAVGDRASRAQVLENVFAAVRQGDTATARRLAVGALARGVEHPVLLNLRALDHEEGGRLDDALKDLRRAHVLAPEDYSILNSCGLCLARMERREEALRCYEQALRLNPQFGQAWFNRGHLLERLGQTGEAAKSYARAVEIHPQNVQAWANMAMLDSRRGDAEATRENAERALALQPGNPTAVLALASIELTEPKSAEKRLRGLLTQTLTPFDRGMALGQLADVLDILDKPAQAFDAYAASNAIFRTSLIPRFAAPGRETVADVMKWLLTWADLFDPKRWVADETTAPSPGGERGHVFLLGFPRSGTTLMESVLAAHPDVVSLEERETLNAAVLAYLASARDLTRLPSARAAELQPLREDYWARVRSFGVEPSDKIFIDKNPFNTLKLPLIKKLFPKAKIIFARRDPREVVLSCFRRRFNFTASTFEFLNLEATATSYAGTMRLAELLRTKLGFDEFVLVYEELITDFPAVARAACEFIGAEWRPELSDFAGRAQRGEVASASSAQIARGLYTEGTSHWRRYGAQVAPVLPILAPWVERFGYPAE
jgi:tetratricopeptide (TPR) repeat protein